MAKRLLFCGDGCVSSGFARATHHYLAGLQGAGWEVTLLALNYDGRPSPFQKLYKDIWPAMAGGDAYGLGLLPGLLAAYAPDVFLVQNDPWNLPAYQRLAGNTPTVGILPVDGLNCRGAGLNGLAQAVFWTDFGAAEAARGGYQGPSAVVPLGVNRTVYRPVDREAARAHFHVGRALETRGFPADAFIVGVCGRNQERKRLDLTLRYFAEWVQTHDVPDAVLWLHVAPTGDHDGYDLPQLAAYYRIANRIIAPTVEVGQGVHEEALARVYGCWDAYFTTTQGEGFGLPALEAMACGVPVLAPRWAALGDWAAGAACLVPCTETAATTRQINSIGGIADRAATIAALDRLYRDADTRASYRAAGLARAAEARFDWGGIGQAVAGVVADAVAPMRCQPRELQEAR